MTHFPANTKPFEADMLDVECGNKVIQAAIAEFGKVDILVNNAGIYPFSPTMDLAVETWDAVLNVNLRGTFLMSQAFARHIRDRDDGEGGAIVNIGSICSFKPALGVPHYDASKGGVLMLTKNLALELAPLGVRVNMIAPGLIATEGTSGLTEDTVSNIEKKILMHRRGTPDDIGTVALMLCTPMSAYMTGSSVVVDGGVLQA